MDEINTDTNICPKAFLDLSKANETVLDTIRKYLEPDKNDKKMFGEVFTPLYLVCDMLSKLPRHVWTNPDLVWLDPANGIGNFPVVVYYKLMSGLEREIPNKTQRSRHIIENMLWMVELNPVNVNVCKKIFNILDPKSTPNIITGSFLEENTLKTLPSKFDVIIGNPPYNSGGSKQSSERGIYKIFAESALSLLHKNGYLLFIHPPNYHRINKDEFYNVVKEHNLMYVRIFSEKEIKDLFNITGVRVDYYLLQKKSYTGKTIIQDDKNNITTINISLYDTIPNFGFSIIDKLFALQKKIGSYKSDLGRSSKFHTTRIKHNTAGKYKYVHTITKDGINYTKSDEKQDVIGIPKLIFNGFGYSYIYYDETGNCGTTQVPFYLLNPTKKDLILFMSPLIQYLLDAFRIKGQNSGIDSLVYYLPDLSQMKFNTYKELLEELHITSKEQKEISAYKVLEFPHVFIFKDTEDSAEGKKKRSVKKQNCRTSKSKHELELRDKFRRSVKIQTCRTSKSKHKLELRDKFRRSVKKTIHKQ